jgi:hypothetical protein
VDLLLITGPEPKGAAPIFGVWASLDADSYENLLRPAFKDDERIVVALGAPLGFLFGELLSQIITHFG